MKKHRYCILVLVGSLVTEEIEELHSYLEHMQSYQRDRLSAWHLKDVVMLM